jgi:hypothetical protein
VSQTYVPLYTSEILKFSLNFKIAAQGDIIRFGDNISANQGEVEDNDEQEVILNGESNIT